MTDWSQYDPFLKQQASQQPASSPSTQPQQPAPTSTDWSQFDPFVKKTGSSQTPSTPAQTGKQAAQTATGLSQLFSPTKLLGETALSVAQGIRDAVSGKDITIALKGTGADQYSQTWFNNIGKNLYLGGTAEKQAATEMAKNPTFWDRLGAGLNVASTPFILKDIAEAPFKILGKELPLPSALDSVFSTVNHTIPDAITSGIGKTVQNLFGKFDSQNLANHVKWASEVFPGITQSDLETQTGKHVVDWVQKMANKIHFARGGDTVSKLSNSDILQAWSQARNIWGGDLATVSKNMDKFAQTMDRVSGGIQEMAGKLGIDDSFIRDVTLYTPEYMQQAKTAATKMGNASPSLVDYLKSIKDSIIKLPVAKGQPTPKFIDNMIKAIQLVEKDTGYKVGAGHMSFINPEQLKNIPAETTKLLGEAAKVSPVTRVFNTLKGVVDPQVFTNDAKQSLIQSRFRMGLEQSGLDPTEVIDKMNAARSQGVKFSLSDANAGKFSKIFGEDYKKVMKAANNAGKLPFKISGLSTSQVARRIPGASPLVQALFGVRWKLNPLFQLTKIPTKLYEIAAASGIKPWSPEASQAVAHYLETIGQPMVSRMIDDMDIELQYQTKSPFSSWSKGLLGMAGDNPIEKKLAGFIDHITSADERVYAKAVYKYLADHGADLKSVPADQQLDFVKKIPTDIIGAADNYAKTITKYGQGTSPLQNTLNTIFFPLMFHMKVAKFALEGTLRYPLMAKTIGDLVTIQNKWALSPEGQQWHQTPGLAQSVLHAAGYAEPINIPALTGRDETLGQTVSRFTTPYNPLSPILQGVSDVTGKQLPTTQPPTSKFEVQHPVLNAVFGLTGTSYAAIPFLEKQGAISGTTGSSGAPTMKTIKKEMQRQATGAMPPANSVLASLRNFQGTNKLTDVQKLQYARMRANYDFPDDKTKQNKEITYILNLWKRVRPPKQ